MKLQMCLVERDTWILMILSILFAALKSLLSNDWSENDRETWGDRHFGPCKNKPFLVSEKAKKICRLIQQNVD